MLSCLLFATTSTAIQKADVQITGGFGIKVNITNTGDEPIFGIPWLKYQTMYFPGEFRLCCSPGLEEPLQPGESVTWRHLPLWCPFYRLIPRQGVPLSCLLIINAKIYGVGNIIYGEKTINALYLCGFVIPLSE